MNNEKRYRDVTEQDIGKLVEVRDNLCDPWHTDGLKRINYKDIFQYKCYTQNWRYARIAVEEEPKVEIKPEANPEPWKPDPGEGYRLLSKDPAEKVIKGDEFFDDTVNKWIRSMNRSQSPELWYRRKAEVPEYRTPHPGDVGKRIEVRDSDDPSSDESRWVERTLVAVLSLPGKRPQGNFVTAVEGYDAKRICHTWRFARIKKDSVIREAPAEAKPEPWKPKVGDWVLITKPAETLENSTVWMQGMDRYDGAVVQVSQVLEDDSIEVDDWSFLFAWLTPCEAPKVHFNASPDDDSFLYIELDIEFPFCGKREPETSFTTTFSTTSTGKQSHLDADYTLLPTTATRLVAECLAYGHRKYGEGNYKRISIKDHLNHAVAQIFEHLSSDDTEDHLIHAATRLLLALELCSDRDRKYQEPKEVQGE